MKTKIHIPESKHSCEIKNVALFGSADIDENHPLYSEAFNVARYLAYHDKVVVNGGGPGVMDAATKGAQAAGGETLTVTFAPDRDMGEFEGQFNDNTPDHEIKTANYVERMFGLMEHSDVFICFQGGTGTLSEWATAWLLAHLYHGKHKPLILYGEFWEDVMKVINEHFFIGEKEHEVYRVVKDEEGLVAAIMAFEEEMQSRCEDDGHEH